MLKRVVVLILLLSVLFVNCFPVSAHADLWDGLKYSVSSIWDGSFFMDPAGSVVNYWKELFGVGDEPVHDAESYNTYIINNYPANMYSSSGDYLFQVTPDMVTWAELSSPGLLGSIYYIQDFPIGRC